MTLYWGVVHCVCCLFLEGINNWDNKWDSHLCNAQHGQGTDVTFRCTAFLPCAALGQRIEKLGGPPHSEQDEHDRDEEKAMLHF